MRFDLPENSRCFYHRDRKPIAICSECGAFFCAECGAVVGGDRVLCKKCIGREFGPEKWEECFAGGGVLGFLRTLRWVLLSPSRFFHSIEMRKQVSSVVMFAIIMEVLGSIAVVIYGGSADYFNLFLGAELAEKVMPYINLSLILVSPLIAVASLYILSLIYHLLSRPFGGDGSFTGTLKVIGYSSAANLLIFIPWIGGFLSIFYTLILYSRGFARIHRMGPLRAAAFALVPVMALMLILVVVAIALFQSIEGNLPYLLAPGS
ncbi:MAG: hypothetical protein DRH51_03885 [Candidatus Coatesbacteria bacterium]|nr:MAG: hypothetical protein DRH51_03885 [Candidatus Coatesbacteria bacterium]RLC43949.1 MAG: hypothetical protein DRH44_03895 [Candidatus Coatesbacteria bacterium]